MADAARGFRGEGTRAGSPATPAGGERTGTAGGAAAETDDTADDTSRRRSGDDERDATDDDGEDPDSGQPADDAGKRGKRKREDPQRQR